MKWRLAFCVLVCLVSATAIGIDVPIPPLSHTRPAWRIHCLGTRSATFLQWEQQTSFTSPGGFALAHAKTYATVGRDGDVLFEGAPFQHRETGEIVASSDNVTMVLSYDGDLIDDLVCQDDVSVWLTIKDSETSREHANCSVERGAMMDLQCRSSD